MPMAPATPATPATTSFERRLSRGRLPSRTHCREYRMACTPLNIDVGLFLTTNPWESTPSKSFDGKTVTHTPGGANPGITVTKGPQSLFHQQLNNHTLSYGVLGNKFLVILDVEGGGGSSTRHV